MKRSLIFAYLLLIVVACSNNPATQELPPSTTSAESNRCETIIATALASLNTVCDEVGRNRACYVNDRIVSTLRDVPADSFDAPGDVINIDALETMTLSSYDSTTADWGFAVLEMQANLPDTLPGQNVTFLIFGGTEFTPQGTVDGLQAFYVRTGIGSVEACNEAPDDGILIQTPETDIAVNFSLNGVEFELGSTAFIQAEPDAEMTINLIEGQAVVSAEGQSQIVPAGNRTRVSLDASGIADSAPTAPEPYTADTTRNLPVIGLSRRIVPAAPATITQGTANLSTLANPTNGLIRDEILDAGEEHIIELDLGAGQILFIDGDENSDDIWYTLFAPDGNEIRRWNIRIEDLRFDIEQSGTYRISVYGLNDAVGTYSFNLWDVPQDTNQTISVPATISDEVEAIGAYHYYEFDLTAGQILFIDGDENSADDIWYTLFAPDGNEIRRWNIRIENQRFDIEQSGIYRLRVYGLDDGVGAYNFSLLDVPPDVIETVTTPSDIPASISGQLDVPGQYHFYDFDLTAGQIIFFDGDENSADDIWYTLFAPDGNEIRRWNIRIENQRFDIEQSGIYRLRVYGLDDGVGAYNFSLLDVPPDVIETVTLSTGSSASISGQLDVPGQYHYYEFDLTAGQILFIDGDENSDDIWYTLFAPDGNEIRRWNIRIENQRFDIEQSGTYRLRVYGLDDRVGAYNFSLLDVPPDVIETVTLSTGSSTSISGQLDVPGQYHLYELDLTAGRTYLIEGDESSDDIWYILFAPDGNEIRRWNIRIENSEIDITESGKYQMRISGIDDTTGAYRLQISAN